MVFLKPTILIDSNGINQVSLEKYNFIKAQQASDDDLDLIDLRTKEE